MTKKRFFLPLLAAAGALFVWAQGDSIVIKIIGAGGKGSIAIPDFRGASDAQRFMGTFNQTLWTEVEQSGLFRMVPKTSYPLAVPQQPTDFKPPVAPPPARRGASPPAEQPKGLWLTDWSGPPVNATYLAFGYTAIKDNQLVLFGWFYNVTQNDTSNAQVIGKLYFGPIDDKGARKVAQEFAADILKSFG